MKKIRIFLLMLPLLLFAVVAFPQSRTLTGKVTDAVSGEALAGVNVMAEKQKTTVATKADGTYSISVKSGSTILIVSHTGYITQAVDITGKTTLDVSLKANTAALDEVVVIGYGTQKRSSVTGAVAKYKNDRLDEAPVSRLDQALQGKIAGVQIQNVSSEAGADPLIRVRGVNSVNANASPLIVVDGHPMPNGDALSFINMADVESVEVLKDAASAMIYGSRGANGVIMITTKAGKAEKPKYSLKFSTGFKSQYELYPMMTTSEYTNLLYYEASLKALDPSITPPTGTAIIANNERAAYIVENTIRGGKGSDWQQEALRDALVRNIQLSVSGGKKEVRYFLSAGVQKDQGMMYHSEYDKYNLRGKLDVQLNKKAKFSFNFNPSYIKRERPSVNFIDFVRFQSFLPVYHDATTIAFVTQAPQWASLRVGDFAQARHFNGRTYSGLMPDGSLYTSTAALDPFNTANNTPKSVMETRTITSNDYRVVSSADFTYSILPGLDFKSLASAYVSYTNALDFSKRNSFKDGDINKGIFSNRLLIDMLSENTLTYNKEIKDHAFTVLAGYTYQKTTIKDEQTTGLDFPSDDIQSLKSALQIDQSKAATFNTREQIGLLSYLGRVLYSYKNKYLMSASIRRDGSSYFGPGYKWGNFPAVSVGWVASKEKFMQEVKWVNNLKFRGSLGVSGNNRIQSFAYLDLLYSANYSFGSGNGTSNAGQSPSQNTVLSDRDLTWERTFQYNVGLDAAILKNAITFSLDLYQGKSDSLLLKQSAMGTTGYSQTWNNIGRVQNRGIELEVTSNNIRRKNFKWTTSANISHNKNKLLELAGEKFLLNQGERTELYRNEPGFPLVQFYGFKTDGVWLSQAQIDDAKTGGLTSNLSNVFVPGGLKLIDTNGDKVIDEKDRVVTGNPYADFTWGLTNSFTYKSVDLSFSFQGSQGGELVNGDPNYNETKRYNRNYNSNRWLSPGFPGDGKTPYSTIGFNWMLTDYVVEDASYYALREVVVGYTFPTALASKLHIGSVRAYFSAQNIYFHSAAGYRGINTEARFSSGPYNTPLADGYQRGSFPMPKTYLFGIDINF
ncbi:MAG: TonB-dependent receptor [Ferruginibacter sp.]|nr:TonB-dependent receptor [Ferruginibacter sp.]